MLSAYDIQVMRSAGHIANNIHIGLTDALQVGTRPVDLDMLTRELTKKYKVRAGLLGYRGFPSALSVSVNEVILHGIPDETPFSDGDVVTLDLIIGYRGFFVDCARSYVIGTSNEPADRLLSCATSALRAGIDVINTGTHTGDIGETVASIITSAGFHTMVQFGGHGIGRRRHEQPFIPNTKHIGKPFQQGIAFTIEPIVLVTDTPILKDGTTVKTSDGMPAVHVEETIAITDNGALVLTAP